MLRFFLRYLILPVAVIIIAGCIAASPKVTADSAHTFISNYYAKALQSGQREEAYYRDLTFNFRRFPDDDWRGYNNFWQNQETANINSVIPVSGNPMEFTVNVTFRSKSSKNLNESADFWFVCNGLTSNLVARIPSVGCPTSSLQIDNKDLVTQGQ